MQRLTPALIRKYNPSLATLAINLVITDERKLRFKATANVNAPNLVGGGESTQAVEVADNSGKYVLGQTSMTRCAPSPKRIMASPPSHSPPTPPRSCPRSPKRTRPHKLPQNSTAPRQGAARAKWPCRSR